MRISGRESLFRQWKDSMWILGGGWIFSTSEKLLEFFENIVKNYGYKGIIIKLASDGYRVYFEKEDGTFDEDVRWNIHPAILNQWPPFD